jgi:hypothetical protein
MLALVPGDASVGASENLVPHLASRPRVWGLVRPHEHFIRDRGAEYVALLRGDPHPGRTTIEDMAEPWLRTNRGYVVVARHGTAVLLRKGPKSAAPPRGAEHPRDEEGLQSSIIPSARRNRTGT